MQIESDYSEPFMKDGFKRIWFDGCLDVPPEWTDEMIKNFIVRAIRAQNDIVYDMFNHYSMVRELTVSETPHAPESALCNHCTKEN